MKKLLLLIIVFGGLGFAVLNYHFIVLDDSVKVLKKTEPGVNNTLVDARGTKVFTLLLEPDLVQAGISDVLNNTEKSLQQQAR